MIQPGSPDFDGAEAFEEHQAQIERMAFETWAKDDLGQGYSLTQEEGRYVDRVTRWAFIAWKAGRKQLLSQDCTHDWEDISEFFEGTYTYKCKLCGKTKKEY